VQQTLAYILRLADVSAGLAEVGGKGASPAHLTAAGLPVPPGFHLTTFAWTPLFVLAAGIVTDVGGPLSHSSIVAREYHIPAVLGTGVATERLHSGQRITVDGDAGVVSTEGASA
jgi:phosphoenolpyruvate synthase/pyruvate phosphate dikinase